MKAMNRIAAAALGVGLAVNCYPHPGTDINTEKSPQMAALIDAESLSLGQVTMATIVESEPSTTTTRPKITLGTTPLDGPAKLKVAVDGAFVEANVIPVLEKAGHPPVDLINTEVDPVNRPNDFILRAGECGVQWTVASTTTDGSDLKAASTLAYGAVDVLRDGSKYKDALFGSDGSVMHTPNGDEGVIKPIEFHPDEVPRAVDAIIQRTTDTCDRLAAYNAGELGNG